MVVCLKWNLDKTSSRTVTSWRTFLVANGITKATYKRKRQKVIVRCITKTAFYLTKAGGMTHGAKNTAKVKENNTTKMADSHTKANGMKDTVMARENITIKTVDLLTKENGAMDVLRDKESNMMRMVVSSMKAGGLRVNTMDKESRTTKMVASRIKVNGL